MSHPIQTRMATPADAQAIWQLYRQTNFLYPEKLEAMGDGGAAAFETLQALLSSPHYAIALSTAGNGELLAACTCGRYSTAQTWVMHLVSQHNRQSLLYALVAAGNLAIDSSATWMCNTFRENNTGVQRLLTRPFQNTHNVELATYDFYVVQPEQALALSAQTRGAVRQGGEGDRLEALRLLGANIPDSIALAAIGSLDSTALDPARETAALALDGRGLAGFALLERAPAWWNLSNLSTGVRLWLLEIHPEVAGSLLAAAANWFVERGIERWTILVGDDQTALKAVLNRAGLISTKRYQRLCYPGDLAPQAVRQYVRYLGHSQNLPQVHERPGLEVRR